MIPAANTKPAVSRVTSTTEGIKNLHIADDAVLKQPVGEKVIYAFAMCIGLYLAHCIEHVTQIIARPQWMWVHTGMASASTFSRNVAGRNFGVRRSTLIPTAASSWI